jgi:hypothetical protein
MINLFGGYAIDADSDQFILGKPCKRKTKVKDKDTGEEKEIEVDALSAQRYYPTLGTALYGAYKTLQRDMVHSDTMSLQEAMQACTELEQRIMACGGAAALRTVMQVNGADEDANEYEEA